MPANLTAPGVYIEELPSGVRTIVGVSTSVTAFVGRTRRGPVDRATQIQSFGDFERRFGGLWNQSDLGHVVRQFFENGGREAIVVRVQDGGSASAGRVPGDMVIAATDAAGALAGFDHLRVQVTHGGGANNYALAISAENAADSVLTDGAAQPFTVSVPLSLAVDPGPVLAAATTATTPPVALARLAGPARSFGVDAALLIDPAYTWENVDSAARAALTAAFSFATRQFGQSVTPAEVVEVLQALEGVLAVDLDEIWRVDEPSVSAPPSVVLESKGPATSGGARETAELLLISSDPADVQLRPMPE